MLQPDKPILVTGDVAIDWFETILDPEAESGNANWKYRPRILRNCLPGGSLLLAELCKKACNGEVLAPVLKKPIEEVPYRALVSSEAELAPIDPVKFAKEKSNGAVALMRYKGYAPTASDADGDWIDYPMDASGVKVVVMDDVGNGSRDIGQRLPKKIAKEAIVMYRMCRPLAAGSAWENWFLKGDDSAGRENRVLIIDAEDLRMAGEVAMTKGLSWERTALDFTGQLHTKILKRLTSCPNLIVLLGLDGALLYQGTPAPRATLFFDPLRLEGGFSLETPAKGPGASMAFMAWLASRLVKEGMPGLSEGIHDGLWAARKTAIQGLLLSKGMLSHRFNELDNSSIRKITRVESGTQKEMDLKEFAEVSVPIESSFGSTTAEWTILDEKTRNCRFQVAQEIVINGTSKVMDQVPDIRFGKLLTTFDRIEIESFSSIKNLLLEFLEASKTGANPPPFNLAVFGAPGAGKSFGVKQIALQLNLPPEAILTFNLSQFQRYEDLVAAFHQVRDLGLQGKIPLVFFDEFDSELDKLKLGWLKYFLAPMQDGVFRENGAEHPIGKAIFVFAGGTCASFEEFFPATISDEEKKNELKAAKVPDFVSRLRGKLDILGPNQRSVDSAKKADEGYVIRRAKILRINFEKLRKGKAAHLFNGGSKVLNIDPSVLRALLRTPCFRHGHRSISALLEMSRLLGRPKFDASSLPPEELLVLHVDPGVFRRYLNENTIMTIARAIHEDYIANRKAKKEKIEVAESFDELTTEMKQSNLWAAEDIPKKLKLVGKHLCEWRFGSDQKSLHQFTSEEIEILAEHEHKRWMEDRTSKKWVYGPVRDNDKKIHPDLVEYNKLTERIKDYDRQQIRALPLILANAGFDICGAESEH